MTQDEIIEMARQARLMSEYDEASPWVEDHEITQYVEAFAKLVAAKTFQDGYEKGVAAFNEAVLIEREACAKVCDEYSATGKIEEFDRGWLACAKNVAAAIRARGNA